VSKSPVGKRRGLPFKLKMRHDQHFVEELTARSRDESVGRILALQEVTPDPNQPRNSMGDLSDLLKSIENKGILEPILVRPLAPEEAPPKGKQYQIISGERRYQAASQLGMAEIPAIVMEVDEDEALEIALIENLQRKDLTPFEEAEAYRALGDVHGYTHEQIGRAVGKSRTSVTEAVQLLKMTQPVRNAAEALGIHSRSTLLEILKVTRSTEEQIRLLEEATDSGLNREDLRRQVRAKKARRHGRRPRNPVFTFKDPQKTFSLSLRFRKSTVEKEDLIQALEKILSELRS
jgi:ParB family chromosome partitioning protein